MAETISAKLDNLCRQWRGARGQPGLDAAITRDSTGRDARKLAQTADIQAEAETWFSVTLEGCDGEARFFAAAVLDGITPKRLLGPMITAAVHEPNPSFNRSFVRPAMRCAGPVKVVDALVRIFREGERSERTGALAALYWAVADAPDFGVDPNEVSTPPQGELLDTFLATDFLPLRHQILPWLELGTPIAQELAARVERVTHICRSSADDYLRARVEVQVGESSLLPALPPRDA